MAIIKNTTEFMATIPNNITNVDIGLPPGAQADVTDDYLHNLPPGVILLDSSSKSEQDKIYEAEVAKILHAQEQANIMAGISKPADKSKGEEVKDEPVAPVVSVEDNVVEEKIYDPNDTVPAAPAPLDDNKANTTTPIANTSPLSSPKGSNNTPNKSKPAK